MTDAERLLRWRNDPGTRAQSLSRTEVAPEEHVGWLTHILATPADHRLYIAEQGGRPVGVGRLDLGAGWAEISVTVAPEHRGHGLAGPLIALLVGEGQRLGCEVLTARIRGGNVPSIRAFLADGFVFPPGQVLRLERRL